MTNSPDAESRECGSCSMCCKLLAIAELEKPGDVWCEHVIKRKGCAIYEQRPAPCAKFACGYLTWPVAGEHWLPSACKMVMAFRNEASLTVFVDRSRPNAWKADPHYSDLKRWAREFENGTLHQIILAIGSKRIAIFPDHDVEFASIAEDETIVTVRLPDGRLTATKRKMDDPSIQKFSQGKSVASDWNRA
ncbi:MAG: hypothetical protein R3D89_04835 [Sphingomonadaceae bacterium]